MVNQFSREELIIGTDKVKKLNNSKVAIFGIGGVGSFVAEGLARAGIGRFILIDNDKIEITNINRQIHSTMSTINRYKVDVMKDRILDINPNAKIELSKEFFMPNSDNKILDNKLDYIVDSMDTVTSKIDLIVRAKKMNIKIISAMGTGNKLDPTKLKIADIYDTKICPLAKVMRKELRKRNIKDLTVVFSDEEPINILKEKYDSRKQTPGSISFVPSVAGLIIASKVVKDLI